VGESLYAVAKRALDIGFATLAVVALAPVLLLVALAVWLEDPGAPVIFRQKRCGYGGRLFDLFKFRTMVRDADALKEALRSKSSVSWPDFRLVNDPRVTRIGRILRMTSLDELPQFVNVLKGDMSLVGPRPLIPLEASQVAGPYEARFAMRPGITGRWQTLGRSDIGFDDMVKLDYTYVVAWSFSEDVKLLLRTPGVVADRRGAY
jgi:lipopolysaccharide/colanic/teichoic acid biosynthesis glycosyltransferase